MKFLNSEAKIKEQGSTRSNAYGCSFITEEGVHLTGFSQVTGPSGMLPTEHTYGSIVLI